MKATECYNRECQNHSIYSGGEGPFCYEEDCILDTDIPSKEDGVMEAFLEWEKDQGHVLVRGRTYAMHAWEACSKIKDARIKELEAIQCDCKTVTNTYGISDTTCGSRQMMRIVEVRNKEAERNLETLLALANDNKVLTEMVTSLKKRLGDLERITTLDIRKEKANLQREEAKKNLHALFGFSENTLSEAINKVVDCIIGAAIMEGEILAIADTNNNGIKNVLDTLKQEGGTFKEAYDLIVELSMQNEGLRNKFDEVIASNTIEHAWHVAGEELSAQNLGAEILRNIDE